MKPSFLEWGPRIAIFFMWGAILAMEMISILSGRWLFLGASACCFLSKVILWQCWQGASPENVESRASAMPCWGIRSWIIFDHANA